MKRYVKECGCVYDTWSVGSREHFVEIWSQYCGCNVLYYMLHQINQMYYINLKSEIEGYLHYLCCSTCCTL